MREIVSAVPPGGKVAISRIDPLVGHHGLSLTAGAASVAADATEAARTVWRVNFMRRSCFLRASCGALAHRRCNAYASRAPRGWQGDAQGMLWPSICHKRGPTS